MHVTFDRGGSYCCEMDFNLPFEIVTLNITSDPSLCAFRLVLTRIVQCSSVVSTFLDKIMTSTTSTSQLVSVNPRSPANVDTHVGAPPISPSSPVGGQPVALRLPDGASFLTPTFPAGACLAGRLTPCGGLLSCLFPLDKKSMCLARWRCCADPKVRSVGRTAEQHAVSHAR